MVKVEVESKVKSRARVELACGSAAEPAEAELPGLLGGEP